MKNKLILAVIIFSSWTGVFAQQREADLKKLVETENEFARAVETKGISAAFVEYLTDDGVMFSPQAINGKELWRSRAASPALLSWRPTFVDVSSNGALGYTVGEGQYRPQGKSDATVYYSTYASVWRREPDGNYKAVMDVGITHAPPPTEDKNWTSPKPTAPFVGENKPFAANFIYKFFETATLQSLEKSYKIFASEDVRFLREGKFPILGKKAALDAAKSKSKIRFGKQMTQQSAGDLAYVVTTYEMKAGEKVTEKGNVIQVWKLTGNQWQIVADVFAPVPVE